MVQKGIISNNTSSTDNINVVDEWKFIGLAHRKYRRVWLNIDAILDMCDTNFQRNKVLCIKVDVEEIYSEEQLLIHRSIHAFIGIHGAQLTQGVLLQNHSHVLELLPWIPSYLTQGDWVSTTHCPTPIGVIFSKSQLNHLGYPLDRESVPLCRHVDRSDEEGEKACFLNKTSHIQGDKIGGKSSTIGQFKWDVRNFIVATNVIEDFILYVLQNEKRSSAILCEDMQKRAEEHNFVLYNAYCKEDMNQSGFISRQYYRKKR